MRILRTTKVLLRKKTFIPSQLCAAEIEKLRGHVESMGGHLGEGWSATLKLRTAGQRAGQYDVYFYAPDGAMYRSKVG